MGKIECKKEKRTANGNQQRDETVINFQLFPKQPAAQSDESAPARRSNPLPLSVS
jgi:hypothetical protein